MLRRSGHFYPPAHLLAVPQPGFQLQSRGALCLPCTQYEVVEGTLQYHSFFVALKLPLLPDTLQIESLYLFAADQARAFLEVQREIEALAQEYHCSSLLLRLVERRGLPLFFPSTGFWTSPSNPTGLGTLIQPAGWRESACFSVWELPGSRQSEIGPYESDLQPPFPSVGESLPWNLCRFQLSLAVGPGNDRMRFSLIPDLAPEIASYGKLSPLIRWRLFPQVRLNLEEGDESGAECLVPVLMDWLGRQGIQAAQIGNIPADRRQWLRVLNLYGRPVATIYEYARSPCRPLF